ncbi:hypothetical protein HX882_32075 [Pseudomonas gingeri]|uniref:Uncharacterized protein n=1 Tax=Pseudomonas gingeri TaxID=117681 RepID=A0A7Y8C5S8_9PSED|nr:hypothetical protein [Pseudomonas gingeri]NWC00519.1 hypothetical protein [Pseudomonas gingeri]
MGLLEVGILMAVMSVGAAFGSTTIILTKEEKAAYKKWMLDPKFPTLSDFSSGKFPLICMMGYLFRLLFAVGVVCVIVSIYLK